MQIMTVYDSLARNDGNETPGPFYITLGARPSFASRLSDLMVGASEDKGLSEMCFSDEDDAYLDDEGVPVDLTKDSELFFDSFANKAASAEKDPESGESIDDGQTSLEPTFDQSSSNVVVDESTRSIDPQKGAGSTSSNVGDAMSYGNNSMLANADEVDHGDSSELGATSTTVTPGAAVAMPTTEAEDADQGDLIDYEDEEYEQNLVVSRSNQQSVSAPNRDLNGTYSCSITPCYKPSSCICLRCRVLVLEEYEAINEELRRSSLSRTTEEATNIAGTDERHIHTETTTLEDEASEAGPENEGSITFDGEPEADVNNAESHNESNMSAHASDTDDIRTSLYTNGTGTLDEGSAKETANALDSEATKSTTSYDVDGQDAANGDHVNDEAETTGAFQKDSLDTVAGEDDLLFDDEIIENVKSEVRDVTAGEAETSHPASTQATEPDVDDIDYDEIPDVVEPEIDAGINVPPVKQEGRLKEDELLDEIDYDEDESLETEDNNNLNDQTVPSPAVSNGTSSGKRPRSEEEPECLAEGNGQG